MPTPQSLSLGFFAQPSALHFSSTHLLGCFWQMITGCSISIFVLLHWHKWAQVLPVPAPYHGLKGHLSLQSHFTVQNCLCLISCLLGTYRILLISLWEQRHTGVYFFFKSQLLQQLTFPFFWYYHNILGKNHLQHLILIKPLLHFNFCIPRSAVLWLSLLIREAL